MSVLPKTLTSARFRAGLFLGLNLLALVFSGLNGTKW
jgi:hypothetical protein